MTALESILRRVPEGAEPVWQLALRYPPQGAWSEAEYFELEDRLKFVELVDGRLEFLPWPTLQHQAIVTYIFGLLFELVQKPGQGQVMSAGALVRVRENLVREPDLLVYFDPRRAGAVTQYLERPDVVVEVVSPDDPKRDYVAKVADYASAGVREYWIVDPLNRRPAGRTHHYAPPP